MSLYKLNSAHENSILIHHITVGTTTAQSQSESLTDQTIMIFVGNGIAVHKPYYNITLTSLQPCRIQWIHSWANLGEVDLVWS